MTKSFASRVAGLECFGCAQAALRTAVIAMPLCFVPFHIPGTCVPLGVANALVNEFSTCYAS